MALDEDECCVTCVNGNHVYNEISLWFLPFGQPALNITSLYCLHVDILYRSEWI